MKNFGRFIKGTAAAAICALSLTGCDKYSKMLNEDTLGYIEMAAENTVEATAGQTFANEIKVAEKALEDGTFGLSFEIDDVSFTGDCYVNGKDSKTSQSYKFGVDGKSVEAYLAAAEDVIKMGATGASGSYVYELNAKTLADDFRNSVFAPGSGSDLEMSQEDFDMIVEAFTEVAAAANGNAEEDASAKALEEAFNNIIAENPPVIEEKAEAQIDGTAVTANIITYNFDKDDVKKLVDVCFETMSDEISENLEEGQSIEDVKAEMDTAFAEMDTLSFGLVYYVNSDSHCLMQAEFKLACQAEEETVNAAAKAVYGADPASAVNRTFELSAEMEGKEYIVTFITTKTDENTTDVAVSVKADSMTMELAVLTFARNDETYRIDAKIPLISATASLEGTVKTTDTTVDLTADKVTYGAEGISGEIELGVKAYVKQGGTYDDRASQGNLLKLSEEELKAAVTNIANDFAEVFSATDVGAATIGTMNSYVAAADTASADANAKTVYVAFSTVLTDMAINGINFYDYEYYNETAGDFNLVINGYDVDFNEIAYDAGLAEYLGAGFGGYYYVGVNSGDYTVEYALWSEEPIEYPWQYTEEERQEFASEDGVVIGVYPMA